MTKKDYDMITNETLRVVSFNVKRARGPMKQEELALRAGIARQTISNIENGKSVNLDSLIKIAVALGVDPADLFLSEKDKREVTYKFRLIVQKLFNSFMSDLSKQ